MDKMLEIKLLLGAHLDRIDDVKEIVDCDKSNSVSEIAQACCVKDSQLQTWVNLI